MDGMKTMAMALQQQMPRGEMSGPAQAPARAASTAGGGMPRGEMISEAAGSMPKGEMLSPSGSSAAKSGNGAASCGCGAKANA
jgi:hypothetical protein